MRKASSGLAIRWRCPEKTLKRQVFTTIPLLLEEKRRGQIKSCQNRRQEGIQATRQFLEIWLEVGQIVASPHSTADRGQIVLAQPDPATSWCRVGLNSLCLVLSQSLYSSC